MYYRVHQFIHAFFPLISSSEIKWAIDNLSPEACSLFFNQSRPEQRHAIDVAKSIMPVQHDLTQSDFHTLLTAALLHDCGKSVVPLRLWHRVYIVLMQKMPQTLWSRLEQSPTFLAIPLKTAAQHSIWGEDLAQKAGLSADVCRLIREHHTPQTDLGRILAKADNAH
ncbi:MAG TPA: HD domain-containing protein [Desulfosporosinus sp.]